jgi:signal peptide peptidase SppA
LPTRLAFAERPLCILPSAALALGYTGARGGADRGYLVSGGVAVVKIRGSLANRAGDPSFSASFQGVRATIGAALADPLCCAVLLDVDSPGDDAAGAMETSAFIREAATRKPVVAFVDGMACSAAYALACGAQDIVVAPSATLGSIGVVMLHWDMSKYLDDIGFKPTLLHCGAFKADGASTHPLKRDAAARLQHRLAVHFDYFVETVGAHRPTLGAAGARRTEAGLFVGSQAVEAKLADRVGALGDAIALASSRAGGRLGHSSTPISNKAKSMRVERPRNGGPASDTGLEICSAKPPQAQTLTDYELGARAFAAALGKAPRPLSGECEAGARAFAAALGKPPLASC